MVQVYEGANAVLRLEDLTLTIHDLEYALAVGDREARRYCTAHDPPSMSGLARWAGTVRGLRDRLTPGGWSIRNPRNLPVTLAPEGAFGIVAVTGDESTGIQGFEHPSTRRPPGVVTLQAIERNLRQIEEQLAFPFEFDSGEPDGLVDDAAGEIGSQHLWILLYREAQDKIWAELSLPLSVSQGGVVERWHERILIPTYSPQAEAPPNG